MEELRLGFNHKANQLYESIAADIEKTPNNKKNHDSLRLKLSEMLQSQTTREEVNTINYKKIDRHRISKKL